ncbi:MAG: hypothetical protein IJL26_00300 [Clostridia bacterium]|nr:hypothetical protein [Clostridia bacterium]
MTGTETKKRKPTKTDAAALAAFFLLAAALLLGAFYADVIPDEAYYYTLPQRLAQGDRFFVELWQMSQLCGVFLILPYRLFVAATGSTEGIVLFMRLLFAAVDLMFYVYFYLKLRDRKIWGVFAAFLICADRLFGMLSLNYYNLALLWLAAAGTILFLTERPLPAPKLILVGVLLSASVLSLPGLAAVYALFTLLVPLRKIAEKKQKPLLREYAYLLNGRSWGWVSAGVLVCAAAFLIFLQAASGLGNIFAGLSDLFSDSEYQITLFGNSAGFSRVPNAASVFGLGNLILMPAVLAAAAWYRWKRPGKKLRTAIFLAALAGFALCHTVALTRLARCYMSDPTAYFFYIKYCSCSIVPLYVYSLVLYLLNDRADQRLFLFWLLGAAASLGVDFFSDVTLGYGARIAYLPALCWLGELCAELRGTPEKRDIRKTAKRKVPAGPAKRRAGASAAVALCSVCAACAAVSLFAQQKPTFAVLPYNYVAYYMDLYASQNEGAEHADGERADQQNAGQSGENAGLEYYYEEPVMMDPSFGARTVPLPNGPYKGLRNTEAFAARYAGVLHDLDSVASTAEPLYIAGNLPYCSLYAKNPAASYSSLFVKDDNPARAAAYWDRFPEKRPKYIYIPYSDAFSVSEEVLDSFYAQVGGDVRLAEAGYILTVN